MCSAEGLATRVSPCPSLVSRGLLDKLGVM